MDQVARGKNWHGKHYPDGTRKPAWKRHRQKRSDPSSKPANAVRRRRVNKLKRGEQITDYNHLHRAMADWKAEVGDPRPRDLTLSLICEAICTTSYMALDHKKPKRVCLQIAHYIWESREDNWARS